MRKGTLFLFTLLSLQAKSQTAYGKDFAYYWCTVKEHFAYFDSRLTDWEKVKAIYAPVADTVTTKRSFIRLLENVNHELYNGHVSLNTNLSSSYRLIPTGSDLWIAHRQNRFVITAVREGHGAQRAGLREGMIVRRLNGQPMDSAVLSLLPKSVTGYDSAVYEYAANTLLAGTWNTKRTITVVWNGIEKTFYPDSGGAAGSAVDTALLEHRLLPANVGYIRINNSLGNIRLVKAFDQALDSLWHAKGLILDLTETPSGGNTTVARGIMSRFIDKEMPYQKHSLPNEERDFGIRRSWVELVTPRGKIFQKPVVVLTGRWTGSMGEGLAIGFDGMKRATIVGDRMAGLLGAIHSFTLPETGIRLSIPAEKLFHVNGTPRERFLPRFPEGNSEKRLNLALKILSRTK